MGGMSFSTISAALGSIFALAASLALLGCGGETSCLRHSDCTLDRVCVAGTCMPPPRDGGATDADADMDATADAAADADMDATADAAADATTDAASIPSLSDAPSDGGSRGDPIDAGRRSGG